MQLFQKEKVMDTEHKIIIADSTDMNKVETNSVHLIVTSPPYPMIEMWDEMFKKAGAETYEQMHEYLAKTWKECYRVLVDGGICCINIGDATRSINGGFRLYPNHAKITEICENLGFQSLPYILWKKATNKPNAFLGSGFLPPNAYVTQDHEFILIFRKGNLRKFENSTIRHESKYTKEERDTWFSQTWEFNGVKQGRDDFIRRTAEYPEEIPYRLIRMFSCIGDTVLDPFIGTGTTIKVAKENNRNSIGFEIEKSLIQIIKEKIGANQNTLDENKVNIEFIQSA